MVWKTSSRFRILFFLLLFGLLSLLLGLVLTSSGLATWDSAPHFLRSRWLLSKWGLITEGNIGDQLKWYGPLWETVLAIFSLKVFAFLQDPIWVRTSITFAVYPLSLLLTFYLLIKVGVGRATAFLCVSLIFGIIRLAGQALINPIDFPFACSYWLVTLGIWTLFQNGCKKSPNKFPYPYLFYISLLSVIPYLIRPPMLLHFALVPVLFFMYTRFVLKPGSRTAGWKLVPWSLFFGLAVIWISWPSIWEMGWRGWLSWIHTFHGLARFPWQGTVTLFGITYQAGHLPLWYPFAWPMINTEPVAFLVMLIGLLCLLFFRGLPYASVEFSFLGKIRTFSLQNWILLVTALSWAGIMLGHPVIYDEDRHLLFLFPLLMLLAAFGLDFLPSWPKYVVSTLIIASSTYSYLQWGKYSYVYKSPFISNRHVNQFMGDYWGVCLSDATTALRNLALPGSEVWVWGPLSVVEFQAERLMKSRAYLRHDFGPFQFVSERPTSRSYFIISYNRDGLLGRVQELVQLGKVRVVWKTLMPPGDPACLVAETIDH